MGYCPVNDKQKLNCEVVQSWLWLLAKGSPTAAVQVGRLSHATFNAWLCGCPRHPLRSARAANPPHSLPQLDCLSCPRSLAIARPARKYISWPSWLQAIPASTIALRLHVELDWICARASLQPAGPSSRRAEDSASNLDLPVGRPLTARLASNLASSTAILACRAS
jgi:hypothetical protein